MHIKKVSIQNLRSIRHFEMEFEQPAGWHVLIGDNGSGKTSALRGIALGLIGSLDAMLLRLDVFNYVNYDEKKAIAKLNLVKHDIDESLSSSHENHTRGVNLIKNIIGKTNGVTRSFSAIEPILDDEEANSLAEKYGWFSAAFGAFRRFTGGDKDIRKLYKNYPKATGHVPLFGDDVALTETINWLVYLNYRKLEIDKEATTILKHLKTFINDGKLLPHGVKITKISSDGVFLTDANGQEVDVTEMSNGFRSVLSMTFEIIRQMVLHFDAEKVFESIKKGTNIIGVSGVILIDEVDAHLHPTWQTEIGLWFIEHFPNIQFIVTTHSPLVCRACERGGSIWRIENPNELRKITGVEKDRLIDGDILDAYGTNLFGQSPARAAKSNEKRKRLGQLNILHALGKINEQEEKERRKLQRTFTT